jgi:hypothetical protein
MMGISHIAWFARFHDGPSGPRPSSNAEGWRSKRAIEIYQGAVSYKHYVSMTGQETKPRPGNIPIVIIDQVVDVLTRCIGIANLNYNAQA